MSKTCCFANKLEKTLLANILISQYPNLELMLLYNVTITIDLDAREDWLRWMRDTHIPDVMSTGMFISYRMSRLLEHEHVDSEIFSIQYLVKDMAHLRRYQAEFAPELQRQHRERFEGRFAAFRTLMEVIEHNERGFD